MGPKEILRSSCCIENLVENPAPRRMQFAPHIYFQLCKYVFLYLINTVTFSNVKRNLVVVRNILYLFAVASSEQCRTLLQVQKFICLMASSYVGGDPREPVSADAAEEGTLAAAAAALDAAGVAAAAAASPAAAAVAGSALLAVASS